jgi:hypothetical protein
MKLTILVALFFKVFFFPAYVQTANTGGLIRHTQDPLRLQNGNQKKVSEINDSVDVAFFQATPVDVLLPVPLSSAETIICVIDPGNKGQVYAHAFSGRFPELLINRIVAASSGAKITVYVGPKMAACCGNKEMAPKYLLQLILKK